MTEILVTGAAGFVGFHVCQAFLAQGKSVVGLDNLNDYYSVDLKQARLNQLTPHPGFQFAKLDLADRQSIADLFATHTPTYVVHLAAQAGVRYSLENPHAYADSNLIGFLNILEGCRHHPVKHLLYASSSSVYGANTKIPFSTDDLVDYPVSLYAATKKANELMGHCYSHLYNIPMTGLRFFTVYGPWGRPDMAYFLFTKAIADGKPIRVFNHGKMQRDFTYIDDVIEGILRLLDRPPSPNQTTSAPFKIYNIGNHQPVTLLRFIEVIGTCMGKVAEKEFLPMQPGDVPLTYADITDLQRDVGYAPSTPIETGLANFVDWFRSYYQS